ncbi:hypothetical protein FO519_008778 [Halicephalobus sp. NKZ332]|nr:hypothetical protein FO519_008778 [Halicephalobus sp. NKZ332]
MADKNQDGDIDLKELEDYTKSEDSYIYFANSFNIPPPETVSMNFVDNLLGSIGLDPSSEVFQVITDPETKMINTSDFLDALHKVNVDPSKLNCIDGIDCSILFLPVSTIYEKADADLNGVLSFQEFTTSDGIQKWRKMIFPPYDSNKDGMIDLGEWENFLSGYVSMELERLNATSEEDMEFGNSTNDDMVMVTTVAATTMNSNISNNETMVTVSTAPGTTVSQNASANGTLSTVATVNVMTTGLPVLIVEDPIATKNIPIDVNPNTAIPIMETTTDFPGPSTLENATTENIPIDINLSENSTTIATVTGMTMNNISIDVNSSENSTTIATVIPVANTTDFPDFTNPQSSASRNPQCTGAEKTETFMTMAFNLSFCGGQIMDYKETFFSKDLNSDGVLSPYEFESGCFIPFVEKLFCMSDLNEDGLLDPDEFRRFIISEDEFKFFANAKNESPPEFLSEYDFRILLEGNGINSTNPNFTEIYDYDRNNSIEFSEWELFLSGYVMVENFSRVFDSNDFDEDGSWNKQELREFLKSRGFERKNAWEAMQDYGKLTKDVAFQFVASLPNPKFRYFTNSAPDDADPSLVSNRLDPLVDDQ